MAFFVNVAFTLGLYDGACGICRDVTPSPAGEPFAELDRAYLSGLRAGSDLLAPLQGLDLSLGAIFAPTPGDALALRGVAP